MQPCDRLFVGCYHMSVDAQDQVAMTDGGENNHLRIAMKI